MEVMLVGGFVVVGVATKKSNTNIGRLSAWKIPLNFRIFEF
jgi:hypothetical protein